MIIYHALLTILWGYLSHFTYAKTRLLGNGWSQIAAYTLGSVAVFPSLAFAFAIVYDDEQMERRETVLARLLYLLVSLFTAWIVAYGSFGLGTVVGWIVNPYEGPMMDEGD